MSGIPRLESARLLHFAGPLALLPGDGATEAATAAATAAAVAAPALFYNPFDDDAADDDDGDWYGDDGGDGESGRGGGWEDGGDGDIDISGGGVGGGGGAHFVFVVKHETSEMRTRVSIFIRDDEGLRRKTQEDRQHV